MHCSSKIYASLALLLALGVAGPVAGQAPAGSPPTRSVNGGAPAAAPVSLPPGYVIGAADVLSIVFWRDKDMSADVVVRPDGKISLPLLKDIDASGFTPEQLRLRINEAAGKLVEEPNATVVVKEIHSRNVFITGVVNKPGTFPLVGEMTVLQLIAVAGGLQEYADSEKILVVRLEAGRQNYYKFNYKDVLKQKHVEQNITLKPGDTVVVP